MKAPHDSVLLKRVTLLLVGCVGVATVQLQHVDAPVGEGLRVRLDLVQRGSWISAAGVSAHVSVDAQLQAAVVNVLR